MKKTVYILLLFLTMAVAKAQSVDDKAPTMGWSSWNSFGFNISDQIIRNQALLLSKFYLPAGYRYLNIDDGYFGGRDKNGHLLIHPERFPNGMKSVVDYIHKLGLKAGIYSDGGHDTCASYFGGDKIGVGVGLMDHDQEDCDFFFKELGFDFIKVDFCGGSPYHNKDGLKLPEEERYRAIWQAIQNTGRDDVRLNVCRWAFPGTWVHEVATSWRTTGDINCSWGSVKDILKENFYLSAYATDGKFNDMDMLEVGRGLTAEEDRTHFGMWCIMASPLLLGCDLSKVSATSRALLLNEELIALNQDPLHLQAYVVKRVGDTYILVKDIEEANSTVRAVAMLNLSEVKKTMTLDFADIDLGGKVKMRDCFKKQDLDGEFEGTYTVDVPKHGVKIYRVEAEQRLDRTLYEAETAYLSAYQELENNQTKHSGTYSENNDCSGGAKAGWLGMEAGNDLQWRNVYSRYGGTYKMTIDYISGESRSMTIEVNGKKLKTESFNSGGWEKIGSKTYEIELNAGNNTIRLYTASNNWMPDIDCMRLQLVSLPEAIGTVKTGKKSKGKTYRLNGTPVDSRTLRDGKGIFIIDGEKRLAM